MQRRSFLITPPALAMGAMAGAVAPGLAAPAVISHQSRILPRRNEASPHRDLRRRLGLA